MSAAAGVSTQTEAEKPKSGRRPVYAPRRYWSEVEDMPPLSHWPDRNQPFDYARSEVIAFIMARCGVSQHTAVRIFNSANSKGVLRFNRETRQWRGTKGGAA